jgi:phosphoadenosine phosphosulfate reductase
MNARDPIHPIVEPKARAALALLERVARDYRPAALASSLGAEDMLLTDLALTHGIEIEIFVIDTRRLHLDTLELIDAIKRRYGAEPRVYAPDPAAVAEYIAAHGRDAFYGDAALRKRCCEIRKVEPLARALAGKRAWITGQRREQSPTRTELALQEHDAAHGIEKFNPLADWSEAEVWRTLRERDVPVNRLYDQGYRSIGCAPCTRPVLPGEDLRAGRWWWEAPESRECGLHLAPDGRLVRARKEAV